MKTSRDKKNRKKNQAVPEKFRDKLISIMKTQKVDNVKLFDETCKEKTRYHFKKDKADLSVFTDIFTFLFKTQEIESCIPTWKENDDLTQNVCTLKDNKKTMSLLYRYSFAKNILTVVNTKEDEIPLKNDQILKNIEKSYTDLALQHIDRGLNKTQSFELLYELIVEMNHQNQTRLAAKVKSTWSMLHLYKNVYEIMKKSLSFLRFPYVSIESNFELMHEARDNLTTKMMNFLETIESNNEVLQLKKSLINFQVECKLDYIVFYQNKYKKFKKLAQYNAEIQNLVEIEKLKPTKFFEAKTPQLDSFTYYVLQIGKIALLLEEAWDIISNQKNNIQDPIKTLETHKKALLTIKNESKLKTLFNIKYEGKRTETECLPYKYPDIENQLSLALKLYDFVLETYCQTSTKELSSERFRQLLNEALEALNEKNLYIFYIRMHLLKKEYEFKDSIQQYNKQLITEYNILSQIKDMFLKGIEKLETNDLLSIACDYEHSTLSTAYEMWELYFTECLTKFSTLEYINSFIGTSIKLKEYLIKLKDMVVETKLNQTSFSAPENNYQLNVLNSLKTLVLQFSASAETFINIDNKKKSYQIVDLYYDIYSACEGIYEIFPPEIQNLFIKDFGFHNRGGELSKFYDGFMQLIITGSMTSSVGLECELPINTPVNQPSPELIKNITPVEQFKEDHPIDSQQSSKNKKQQTASPKILFFDELSHAIKNVDLQNFDDICEERITNLINNDRKNPQFIKLRELYVRLSNYNEMYKIVPSKNPNDVIFSLYGISENREYMLYLYHYKLARKIFALTQEVIITDLTLLKYMTESYILLARYFIYGQRNSYAMACKLLNELLHYLHLQSLLSKQVDPLNIHIKWFENGYGSMDIRPIAYAMKQLITASISFINNPYLPVEQDLEQLHKIRNELIERIETLELRGKSQTTPAERIDTSNYGGHSKNDQISLKNLCLMDYLCISSNNYFDSKTTSLKRAELYDKLKIDEIKFTSEDLLSKKTNTDTILYLFLCKTQMQGLLEKTWNSVKDNETTLERELIKESLQLHMKEIMGLWVDCRKRNMHQRELPNRLPNINADLDLALKVYRIIFKLLNFQGVDIELHNNLCVELLNYTTLSLQQNLLPLFYTSILILNQKNEWIENIKQNDLMTHTQFDILCKTSEFLLYGHENVDRYNLLNLVSTYEKKFPFLYLKITEIIYIQSLRSIENSVNAVQNVGKLYFKDSIDKIDYSPHVHSFLELSNKIIEHFNQLENKFKTKGTNAEYKIKAANSIVSLFTQYSASIRVFLFENDNIKGYLQLPNQNTLFNVFNLLDKCINRIYDSFAIDFRKLFEQDFDIIFSNFGNFMQLVIPEKKAQILELKNVHSTINLLTPDKPKAKRKKPKKQIVEIKESTTKKKDEKQPVNIQSQQKSKKSTLKNTPVLKAPAPSTLITGTNEKNEPVDDISISQPLINNKPNSEVSNEDIQFAAKKENVDKLQLRFVRDKNPPGKVTSILKELNQNDTGCPYFYYGTFPESFHLKRSYIWELNERLTSAQKKIKTAIFGGIPRDSIRNPEDFNDPEKDIDLLCKTTKDKILLKLTPVYHKLEHQKSIFHQVENKRTIKYYTLKTDNFYFKFYDGHYRISGRVYDLATKNKYQYINMDIVCKESWSHHFIESNLKCNAALFYLLQGEIHIISNNEAFSDIKRFVISPPIKGNYGFDNDPARVFTVLDLVLRGAKNGEEAIEQIKKSDLKQKWLNARSRKQKKYLCKLFSKEDFKYAFDKLSEYGFLHQIFPTFVSLKDNVKNNMLIKSEELPIEIEKMVRERSKNQGLNTLNKDFYKLNFFTSKVARFCYFADNKRNRNAIAEEFKKHVLNDNEQLYQHIETDWDIYTQLEKNDAEFENDHSYVQNKN